MNINALNKVAEDESSFDWNGNAAGVGGGLATALLTHHLMAPKDEDKKKESTLSKLMRWLTVAGAGVGGHFLTKGLVGGATPKDVDKAEIDADRANMQSLGARGAAYGVGATGLLQVGKGMKDILKNYLSTTGVRRTFKNVLSRNKGRLGVGGAMAGAGVGLDYLADWLELRAREKKRYLESIK